MKRWQLAAVGTVAYIVILIASAPATLIDAALRRASEGRLRLAEARGTVWSGAGLIEILDAGRHTGIAKNIAWRFLPASLLSAQLVCMVELDSSARHARVTIFPTRIELTDADVSVPATVLGIALPELAPLGLGGELQVQVAHTVIARDRVRGDLLVQWRSASSAHSPVSPLGDYELRLNHAGTQINASLRTLSGPLHLDGRGSWSNGARPAFRATARVAPQFREQLEPLLHLIAVERGAGNFEMELK